jgi:hypothetical protein
MVSAAGTSLACSGGLSPTTGASSARTLSTGLSLLSAGTKIENHVFETIFFYKLTRKVMACNGSQFFHLRGEGRTGAPIIADTPEVMSLTPSSRSISRMDETIAARQASFKTGRLSVSSFTITSWVTRL